MTPEQFDDATPQERNDAVALALGWTHAYLGCAMYNHHDYAHWHSPKGIHSPLGAYGTDLPDYQGDDGLAIRELTTMRHPWRLNYRVSKDYPEKVHVVLYTPSGQDFWADSIAHAACKAILASRETK